MRLRNTLELEDAQGTQVCRIQTRVLHIRDSMAVEDPDGEQLALVHKKLISPLRDRWEVDLLHRSDLGDQPGDVVVDGGLLGVGAHRASTSRSCTRSKYQKAATRATRPTRPVVASTDQSGQLWASMVLRTAVMHTATGL